VTGAVEVMLRTLAAHVRWPVGVALKALLKPAGAALLLPRLKPAHLGKSFSAMLSNTVAVTRLEGGDKLNTIPAEAVAYLDGRTLPGQGVEDLLREVKSVIGDLDLEIEVVKTLPPVETSPDGPLYESITRNLGIHDPTGVPLPYMIPGFTDAKFFSRLGTRCFGFSPLRWPVEDKLVFSELFHGHNERIHAEGFTWGNRVLFDTVADLICPK
jgi:acetylornithine deacetylase/succinyl-diaminopimelate desuccinylase-like protein